MQLDLDAVVLITSVELRRGSRDLLSFSLQSLGMVATILLAFPFFGLSLGLAGFVYTPQILSGSMSISVARLSVLALVGVASLMVGIRTASEGGRIDNETVILLATNHESIFAALVLTEYIKAMLFSAFFILAVGLAMAISINIYVIVGSVLVVSAGGVLLGVLIGYTAGLLVSLAVTHVAFVAKYKTVLSGLLTLLMFASTVLWTREGILSLEDVEVVSWIPLGWLADLAFLPVGVGDPKLAALAVPIYCVSTVLVYMVGSKLSAKYWFTDPGLSYAGSAETATSGGDLGSTDNREGNGQFSFLVFSSIRERIPRSIVRISLKSWRRTYRAPRSIRYALVPLFVLTGPIQFVVLQNSIPGWFPGVVTVAIFWSIGGLFTLNPVEGEGTVLPAILTSGISGREYLSGLVIAAAVPAGPLALGVVVLVSLVSNVPAGMTAFWIVFGSIICITSPSIAALAGVLYPRSDKTQPETGRSVVVPSIWAFLLYSVLYVGTVLPAVIVGVTPFPQFIAPAIGRSPIDVLVGGLIVTINLAVALGAWSFGYVADSIDNYYLE